MTSTPSCAPAPWPMNASGRVRVIFGVLLAQRAARGVAGVGEAQLARGLPRVVHRLELGDRVVDLAADLEQVGWVVGVEVAGTPLIVRTLAVTSSPTRPSPRVIACVRWPPSYTSAIATPSTFSSQVRRGCVPSRPRTVAVVPGAQLLGREGVVQRQHRLAVRDRGERAARRRADLVRRRVRAVQLRVLLLELLQLAHEQVELRVGDLRVRQDVVPVAVGGDRVAQGRDPLPGGARRLSHRVPGCARPSPASR